MSSLDATADVDIKAEAGSKASLQKPAGMVAETKAVPEAGAPEAKKDEDAKKDEPKLPFIKLFSLADRLDYLLMLLGTLGAFANGAAFPMFAIVFGRFTDVFGQNQDDSNFMSQVSQIALYFVYIAIASMFAAYLQGAMWMWTGSRQTARLRQLYLSSVLRQDVAYFDTQTTTGNLLQGLNEDGNLVQAAISSKLAHFQQHVACFFIGYIVAFWRGWDMTLVMFGTLPFLAAVGATLSKLSEITGKKSNDAYQIANTSAQQSISQIRTVAAYNREQYSFEQYGEALKQSLTVGYKQALVVGLCNGSVHAIVYWTYALAFIYGAWRVSTGNYTGGDVMNVLVAALIGGFSAGQAAPVLETFGKGCAAGYRMYSVIERRPSIDVEDEGGLKPDKVLGELEMRDVCFRYPARTDIQVFNHFNLVIPAGKTVALVGSSGSGKSTAAQLIERFYDPESGSVLLDGIDLRQLNLNWLRSQIGLVSQEPTLFATTIFENIAMGKPGATEAEVLAAAEAANAARFIAHLPQRYNTHVGERGLSLSGGQKQRIAIARAILKNPRIMLLDEATSALDTESERIVQEALERLIVGRTTLVIAHRLSTIQDADIITVVSKGRVIESGCHTELIADPVGVYTTLVKLQMKEEVEKQAHGIVEEEPEEAETIPATNHVANGSATAAGGVSQAAAGGGAVPPISVAPPEGGHKTLELGKMMFQKRGKDGDARGSVDDQKVVQRKDGDVESGLVEALVKDPEEDEDKPQAPVVKVPFSRVAALNKEEWPYILVGCIGAAGAGLVQPAFAFIISAMIATFYDTSTDDIMSRASFLSWMFFVIGCGTLLCAGVMFWAFGVAGHKLAYKLRLTLFKNILYQEIGWFDLQENSSSVLTTRLSTDASYVRGAVGDTIGMMMQNLFCLAFGFLIAFVYNWRMALVVLGALPFMISGSLIHYRNMAGMQNSGDKMYNTANQAVTDAFSSIRVVHAYTLKQQVCDLYLRLVSGAAKTAVRQSHMTGITQGYGQFCMFSVYGLIIWFGGLDVNAGRSTFEQMLKAFLAILLAAMGLAQSSVGFPDLGKAKGAIQNVFPLVDRKSQINASEEGGLQPDTFKGAIELQNVKFIYPARPSVVVFRSFSLSIPAGKTVALVGESGSGKSTIVGLIERFYDVQEGVVLIDGIDIKQYSLQWLRRTIGIVSQEPLLFSTSILDNIRYGRPEATMEEVEAAARAANAWDFISNLPDGFNTLVGERGMQLSGGQKQRVAIARAVIKNPRIMLLDEATSALDAQAEREVQSALDRIMVGRTSVVVAHRLSTIRNADVIALVFRGAVLEQGTHEELMELPDGGYAKLVASQMAGSTRSRTMRAGNSRSTLLPSDSRATLASSDSRSELQP